MCFALLVPKASYKCVHQVVKSVDVSTKDVSTKDVSTKQVSEKQNIVLI
jgi:hypothetical protein